MPMSDNANVVPTVAGPTTMSTPMPKAVLLALLIAACAVPLCYALYTDHIWEDSFITLRHSENLLRGNGPVFQPGERVHGFTSPINMLGLALCSWLTGQTSYVATFWLYRILCIAAFAASVALVAGRLWAETPQHALICAGAFGLLCVFDLKMVTFTTNGMETAFMLLALAGAISRLAMNDPSPWLARGLYWGGLMWSRPDGCIYIAALSLADVLFSPGVRGKLTTSLVKSGLVCAIVYGPWFAFAWWYFGSPVPHTITAKGPVEIGIANKTLEVLDDLFLGVLEHAEWAFWPVLCNLDDGRWLESRSAMWTLNSLSRLASVFCLVYWLFPVKDRLGRATSLGFLLVTLYFDFIHYVAPWYLPPATLLGLVTLCRGAVTLSSAALGRTGRNPAGRLHPLALTALLLLAGYQVVLCGLNAVEMRVQQTEIEMGNRHEIGTWLRDHGRPEETVYLEPLGYIGYFSAMHMLDWPGLVSPRIVQVRREGSPGQGGMIFVIRPDWVVLRDSEYGKMDPLREWFQATYSLEAVYDARERLVQRGLSPGSFFPGKPYLNLDSVFLVFRRRDLRPEDFPQQSLPAIPGQALSPEIVRPFCGTNPRGEMRRL
jgi:hypothetical protein